MGDFGTSLVRTLVPLIAGFVITSLLAVGVDLGTEGTVALNAFLTSLISALWYIVFRFAEQKINPNFGWLLGIAKGPTY